MRIATAIGLFTVVPVRFRQLDRRAAAGAMAAFPVVGLILGVLSGAVAWAGAVTGLGLLGALGGIAVLAALTGGLHLDGVADTADGLGSRKPAAEALKIMKRSDIGPMGVITLFFVLGFQAAALGALAADSTLAAVALIVGAMLSRFVVLFATRGATARPGGFGALVAGTPSPVWVAVNALLVVAACVVGGVLAQAGIALSAAAVVAFAAGFAWQWHLRRRLGGTTGDVFGSIIEVTMTVFLVALAVAVRLV